MRDIRYSRSFYEELAVLLEQGIDRFGVRVVAQKRDAVFKSVSDFLVRYPVRPVDPSVGICTYPVTGTPFVLLYDYDDAELRIHLVIHARADRSRLDLGRVDW